MKNRTSYIKKWLFIGGGIFLVLYILNLNATIKHLSAKPSGFSEIYYAAQNISQGTIIEQDMLATFLVPNENVGNVMFTRGEEDNLIGLAARYNLDRGTIITVAMVGLSVDSVEIPGMLTVLAARPISQGEMITSEDLSTGLVQSISSNSVTFFYRDPSEITGCCAKMNINPGEPVTKNMVVGCYVQAESDQPVSSGTPSSSHN